MTYVSRGKYAVIAADLTARLEETSVCPQRVALQVLSHSLTQVKEVFDINVSNTQPAKSSSSAFLRRLYYLRVLLPTSICR
jgi:hypothetical protein